MATIGPVSEPNSLPPVDEAYGIFCGAVNEETVKKLAACLSTATTKNQNVHLLFQSSGGSVGDGVFLYNFFKSLPVRLTIYNVGSVSSIAVIAYLGAKRRVTSAHAVFMIHRTNLKSQGGLPLTVMKGITKSLSLDDERSENILKDRIILPVGQEWSDLDDYDFYFSGKEAVDIGLADEIGEFAPPLGTPVYYFS
jgi:ATP-dependent protease ClpP protease subunit